MDGRRSIRTSSTATNLNKYAELFKTSESGDQGQFLGSDPSFVTNDEALIKNLDLNYKVVYSGSEAATITAFQQATEQKTPLIGYFYDPQWLHQQDQAGQDQPAGLDRRAATPTRRRSPATTRSYKLNKIVATNFAETGGDAVHAHQELQLDQRGPEPRRGLHHQPGDDRGRGAATKWVADNEAKWSRLDALHPELPSIPD